VLSAQNISDVALFAVALQILTREFAWTEHVACVVLAYGAFPEGDEVIAAFVVAVARRSRRNTDRRRIRRPMADKPRPRQDCQ